MKTTHFTTYLMVAATVSIILGSCKKKEDSPQDNDTAAAADNAIAEGYFNDAASISDQAAAGNLSTFIYGQSNESGEKDLMSSCATITIDPVATPHTIDVNFGTANCLCSDGRYRRGIVHVTYSGHYRDSLSSHTITFVDYYVNDNKVEGTHTVTNNGHNNQGHLTYTVSVNGTITKANGGGTITWSSTRTREWLFGESTAAWADDVYLITGNASGTSAAGTSYTATITTALKIKLNCHNIVSGTLDLTPAGKATRTVDWGNGDCDNQVTVTINGHTFNVTLG